MSGRMLECARAEALFVSSVQRSDQYSAAVVQEAIRHTVRRHGIRGCAELVAHEYGEHPEVAARRMLWALDAVRGAYTASLADKPRRIMATPRELRGTGWLCG